MENQETKTEMKKWQAEGAEVKYIPEGLRFQIYYGKDSLEALRDFADTMKACGVLSTIRLAGITMKECVK